MASVRATLLDEEEQFVDVAHVESNASFTVSGYFTSPDGGLYLICEIKDGEPPIDVELTGIWIDGPHPTSRLGRHS